jgi:hypothetical protein
LRMLEHRNRKTEGLNAGQVPGCGRNGADAKRGIDEQTDAGVAAAAHTTVVNNRAAVRKKLDCDCSDIQIWLRKTMKIEKCDLPVGHAVAAGAGGVVATAHTARVNYD